MSDPYMPTMEQTSKTLGSKDSKILIIMDHPDTKGFKAGKVLDGPCLSAFQNCLHQADMITNDIFLTTLVPDDPRPKAWWIGGNSKRPARDVTPCYDRIKSLVKQNQHTIVIAMGDLTHYIMTGRNTLKGDRGYLFPCNIPGLEWLKVLPVQDIKQMVWANYIWRYYLASDLMKAKENSTHCSLKYEERNTEIMTSIENAIVRIERYAQFCLDQDVPISVDIEVSNFEVSHIGLAIGETKGISIPFRNDLWTVEEETRIWISFAKLMSNSKIKKVGQNFIFDIHFLLQQNNIVTNGPILDTMISQSILFPDFLKGLEFLGSTYLNVPSWKRMVSFKNIKEES